MADITKYSASTLAAAAAGRELPTWNVTWAYLSACGTPDTGKDRWYEMWAATAQEHRTWIARKRNVAAADTAGSRTDISEANALPLPEDVRTATDFGRALDALRLRAGLSFRDMERAARGLPVPRRLPVATASDAVRLGRPSRQTVTTFLAACGVTSSQWPSWMGAWERASNAARGLDGAVRVQNADPYVLGVHRAVAVSTNSEMLPVYVSRDVDSDEFGIRARLRVAADVGGFLLLVGDSSIGKTRTAYEAVRAVLPNWWLVHPASTADLSHIADKAPPRTVVWLDEIQKYLAEDPARMAKHVASLLTSPRQVVLVGTIWPEVYASYTRPLVPGDPDPHVRVREVLRRADPVQMAASFSDAEIERAWQAAAEDPRLDLALGLGGSHSLPQHLAGAPALVEHWATSRHGAPYAWAVLTAALDAARLGVRGALTSTVLRAAAVDYCTPRQQVEAPADWFEQALAYATRPLRGAIAALEPVATGMGQLGGYRPADYLLQHVTATRHTTIPTSTWTALRDHLTDPNDITAVIEAAVRRRLHDIAFPLLQTRAYTGDHDAAHQLAALTPSADPPRATDASRTRDKIDDRPGVLAPQTQEINAQDAEHGHVADGPERQTFSEQELAALSRAYGRAATAARLLEQAGQSGKEQLSWGSASSQEIWAEVNKLLAQGKLPDGRRRILTFASREYPGNEVFRGVSAPGRTPRAAGGINPFAGPSNSANGASPVTGTIVALDAVAYGHHGLLTNLAWREGIREVTARAADAVGIPPEAMNFSDRGDGFLALISDDVPTAVVVADFVRELGSALAAYNRTRNDQGRLRFRVAMHHGQVIVYGNALAGRGAVAAVRLVEARALRSALRDYSDANLAVILSEQLFNSTVAIKLRGLNPAAYTNVDVTMGNFEGVGWLTVPHPGQYQLTPEPAGPGKPSVSTQGRQEETLSSQELEVLAEVFCEPLTSAFLLERAGMKRAHQPSWRVQSSYDFWTKVNELLAEGMLPDGRRLILGLARQEYPANPTFQDAGGSPDQAARSLIGRGTDPFNGPGRTIEGTRLVSGTIVALDLDEYSQPAPPVSLIRRDAMEIITRALAAVRIPDHAITFDDHGDGYIAAITTEVPTAVVVADFVRELNIILAAYNRTRNEHGRLRFRLAVHQGQVVVDGTGLSGTPVATASRLVDAKVLRSALQDDPDVDLALIVSDEVYDSTVTEHFRGLKPSAFTKVEINTAKFSGVGWLTVPG